MENKQTKSVLINGAKKGGLQAALHLAESGIKTYIVEESPFIPPLASQIPTGKGEKVKLPENLVVLSNTSIEEVKEEEDEFSVTLKTKPRYIDIKACTNCGACGAVCPVVTKEEDGGKQKAVYKSAKHTIPDAFAIDKIGIAPCTRACPIGTSAQGYVALIAAKKYTQALELVRETNPIPSICARACPRPCETECNRKNLDFAIGIMPLKRFIADYEIQQGKKKPVKPVEITKNEKVAIVGSGPAGLMAAWTLVKMGYKVTIFEKESVAGGMLSLCIPPYRLPRNVIQREIDDICALGVELKLNTPVGKDLNFDDLFNQGYKAIFVAIGAHDSNKLDIPGENEYEGFLDAITFLKEVNMGKRGKWDKHVKVIVVGGGNSAVDSARVAKRLDADVTLLYRRSRAEMPAAAQEVQAMEDERVKVHYLATPVKIIGENGKVTAVECIRMELGEPDSSGRRSPVPIKGSEFTIQVDIVVPAISQSPDLLSLPPEHGMEINKRGRIHADKEGATARAGIFAGGDVVTGPWSITHAMAAGKKAALAIDAYFREERFTEEANPLTVVKLSKDEIINKGFNDECRVHLPELEPGERINDFAEVELGYTEEQALFEAKRCLNCGICSECLQCVKVCRPKAINHRESEITSTIKVNSVLKEFV